MKFVKMFAFVFVAAICAFWSTVLVSASEINQLEWNECESFVVVDSSNTPSNSGLESAFLKVRYEEGNRMVMLFMLTFSTLEEDGNPGVRFSINKGDELYFNLNGESEYNEEEYYLEFISEADIEGRVMFEVIFGIKDGIPDTKEMELVFEDPNGIPSNTYFVKLDTQAPPLPEEPTSEDKTQSDTDKNNKNDKNKTENKTKKTSKTKVEESESVTGQIVRIEADSEKSQGKFVNSDVLFMSAAAVVLIGLLITGAAHYHKRKKHKGDKG